MALTASFTFAFCFIFINIVPSWSAIAKSGVRLIHRDSPLSPYYNPNATISELTTSALRRSKGRLQYFQSLEGASLHDAQTPVRPGKGEYLVEFQIGNPPTSVYAVADTASELIWVRCVPCAPCAWTTRPIFDPSASLTYQPIKCIDPTCAKLSSSDCGRNQVNCQFKLTYGDGSVTAGEYSLETFIFDQTFSHMVLGCSHHTTGPFGGDDSGILGLNRQPASLVSQLKVTKFSYCLVPPNDDTAGSPLILGSKAIISGGRTSILSIAGKEAYYYVSLDGISVGKDRLPIPPDTFHDTNGAGGFIVDSGSTVTTLKKDGYDALVKGLSDRIVGIKRVNSPVQDLDLCYQTTFDRFENTPDVTFHFAGVDLVLTKLGTYVQVEDGIWCLGVASSDSISILGNRAQQNYFVGYDLQNSVISFASAECAIL
ncbi:aspartic proteinase CDR1-like [Aristolochia californica]|uniref:aspartic proteinase CDR1-like n=1 Tax=Aristolochia californica TaxID=171875 RepID=UPI0035E0B00B